MYWRALLSDEIADTRFYRLDLCRQDAVNRAALEKVIHETEK